MSKKLGDDCKAYYSADLLTSENSADDLTWVEMTNMRDATVGLERGEADVSTRGSDWEEILATLRSAPVDFQMMWDTSDAAFSALKTAFMNNTPIALAFMDGDIDTADSNGIAANFTVLKFNRGEPLKEGVTCDISVKPASPSYAEDYTVAGS